jgi:hypothetical protein
MLTRDAADQEEDASPPNAPFKEPVVSAAG